MAPWLAALDKVRGRDDSAPRRTKMPRYSYPVDNNLYYSTLLTTAFKLMERRHLVAFFEALCNILTTRLPTDWTAG